MSGADGFENGFEKFLTAKEAAAALKRLGIIVSPKTLGERQRTKKVPGHKVNGRVRFRLSELANHYANPKTH